METPAQMTAPIALSVRVDSTVDWGPGVTMAHVGHAIRRTTAVSSVGHAEAKPPTAPACCLDASATKAPVDHLKPVKACPAKCVPKTRPAEQHVGPVPVRPRGVSTAVRFRSVWNARAMQTAQGVGYATSGTHASIRRVVMVYPRLPARTVARAARVAPMRGWSAEARQRMEQRGRATFIALRTPMNDAKAPTAKTTSIGSSC